MTKITKYYENLDVNGLVAIKDGTQGTSKIFISDSGGTGTWVSQSSLTGITGGSSAATVANTVFVSKNGSDSTGLIDRLDKPFLTISAATTALNNAYPVSARTSTTRYLVKVFSGYYTERIVLSNYTDYDLSDTILDVVSGANYTIDDNNVACNSIIYGNSQIKRSTAGTLGCVRTQHSATTLTVYADNIISNIGTAIECSNGVQNIIVSSGITSIGVGVASYGGTQTIKCNNITATSYGVWCTGGTQTIYGNVSSTSTSAVVSDGGTQSIYGNVSCSADTAVVSNSGTQFIKGDVLLVNLGGSAACNGGNQTIIGNLSDYIYCASGNQTITGNINGNSDGVVLCDGGVVRVNNGRLTDTTASDVIQGGPTIILNNCTLITSGGGNSLQNGSVVKIYGGCQANTAVGAGVTQQVSAVTVSVNVV